MKVTPEEQSIINQLTANWVWVPDWIDSSSLNTAGRLVRFSRKVSLDSVPARAVLHFSADTRYKLYVNGVRVAVGPARGSSFLWYYDTLDIAPYLKAGDNEVVFVVLRYFASALRAAMTFERTSLPGLTIVGSIETDIGLVDLGSRENWLAQVDNGVLFPTGLVDDVFLHISERMSPTPADKDQVPRPYNITTLNGELSPWRLRPRAIPMLEQSPAIVRTIRNCDSPVSLREWDAFFQEAKPLLLPSNSVHKLHVQADVHSTAFLKWAFTAHDDSHIKLKLTYSEGYELEPRSYPFFRTKADRLDAENGHLIGPFDEVELTIPKTQTVTYEPFWFRTFRLIQLEISVGVTPVELVSFEATQANYPLAVKGSWREPGDVQSKQIWDVSIRTMRNCMFDSYTDCPFYEQLHYSGDTRCVGLFHYLISGDDRLMRRTITNFAASVTIEGLPQSRFPSHVNQIIAGFGLLWVLQVCDHHIYFGDTQYSRSFVPRIDGVLEFFDSHIDDLGLVSGFSDDMWQYVDWVTTWGATESHPDKGVPTSGRSSNRHTFFSMLYAYVLRQVAQLLRDINRPGNAPEYESKADSVTKAIQKHCYDGRFFTDSTADIADELAYSQHSQVFAVLSGAVPNVADRSRILKESFSSPLFSKCSYYMIFYAMRAFALAGDDVYESMWPTIWDPWRKMLANNLTTWEEDDVRQRSDCHAWGSVPLYEYCTELAGVRPIAPGSKRILFKPRLLLSAGVEAKVALGRDNVATIQWTTDGDGVKHVELRLEQAVDVVSRLPGEEEREHGVVDRVAFVYNPKT